MTTINHECYVSLEVAKLLKEAGFDWETFSHWTESDINNPDFKFSGLSDKPILYDGHTPIDEDSYIGRKKDWNNYDNECPFIYNYSAPTLDAVQRWLRKVKNIAVYVCPSYEPIGNDVDDKWIMKWQVAAAHYDIEYEIGLGDVEDETFDTYEEALESGEKKVLVITLEKGV